MKNAGLDGFFEQLLSIAEIEKYKPDLGTYRWAAEKTGVAVGDCMLIAAHGWDITGALRAEMRAAFLARLGKSLYPLAPEPEIVGKDLIEAAGMLIAM